MNGWVILATNSFNQAQVFGTPGGAVYISERRAEEARRKLDRLYPALDFLVMPVCQFPTNMRILPMLEEV